MNLFVLSFSFLFSCGLSTEATRLPAVRFASCVVDYKRFLMFFFLLLLLVASRWTERKWTIELPRSSFLFAASHFLSLLNKNMTIFCGDSRDGVFVYLMAAVMGALYYLKHSSEETFSLATLKRIWQLIIIRSNRRKRTFFRRFFIDSPVLWP